MLHEHLTSNKSENEPWTVNNWMSFSPICFSEEQEINEARERMLERDIRRVIILNQDYCEYSIDLLDYRGWNLLSLILIHYFCYCLLKSVLYYFDCN